MKVLIKTSTPHVDFLWDCVSVAANRSRDFFVVDDRNIWDWGDYDIGISFMHLHKVPKEQLSKPWFNFHPGPLPAYRGRNLCYHAIMNGETEFGATLHYMDEWLDTGDIIEVLKFGVWDWMTAGDLSEKAMDASRSLFIEYLPRIISGEEFARLPNKGGTYYRKLPINDEVGIDEYQRRQIKAITCGGFFPKINVGGVTYKIVRSE